MSQLGTRLLFYEIPAIAPTEEQLFTYARRDEADVAENEYWNEDHFPGASLAVGMVAASPEQRALALTFLRRGRELLRAP